MSRLPRTSLLLPVVAALAVTLGGCGDAALTARSDASALDGEWRLVSTSLSSVDPTMFDTAPVTLVVDGSEVSGRSACNSYSGTLDTDGESFQVTGLGGTDMACEPAVMALESSDLQALAMVDTATPTAGALTLSGAGVELTYEAVAVAVDTPFAGTSWTLDSLITGSGSDGAASSTAAAADLRFDADGTFAGTTGCGRVIGDWLLDDGQVHLIFGDPPRPPGDIRPAPCYPDATAQLEQIMQVLGGPFTATITGDVLTLTISNGAGLVYRAQAGDPADDPAADPTNDPTHDPASGASIDGTWLLQDGSLDGTPITIGDEIVTLIVTAGEGTTTAGCGTTAASATLSGPSGLEIDLGPSSTSLQCKPDVKAVESAYLAALAAVTTYERTGDGLVVSGGGAKLVFEAVVPTK